MAANLVKEYPGAEQYRPRVQAVRAAAHEAFDAAQAELQRAASQMQLAERRRGARMPSCRKS